MTKKKKMERNPLRNEENEKESMRSLKSTSDQVLCFCILVRSRCFHFVRVCHFLRIPSTHPGKGSCVPLPRLLTRRRPINSSSSGSDELDCCFFFFVRFLKIYEQPFIFQHYTVPVPGPIRPLATHIRSINNGLTGHMLQQLLFNYITNERSHTLTGRHFSSLHARSCGQKLLEQKPK